MRQTNQMGMEMPHQLSSYIMVQSILMTRFVPSRHLLFDHLVLVGSNTVGIISIESRFATTGSSLACGSIFLMNALWNPFPTPASMLEHPVSTSKQIAEIIMSN